MSIFRKFDELTPDSLIPWYMRIVDSPIGPYYFSFGWHGRTKAEFEQTCGRFARWFVLTNTIIGLAAAVLILPPFLVWLALLVAQNQRQITAEAFLFLLLLGGLLISVLVMVLLRLPMARYTYRLLKKQSGNR